MLMTPEECSVLVSGDTIIHNGEVLVVTDNDPAGEEVKLARLAFPVGKMRYTSLSTGHRVESRFA